MKLSLASLPLLLLVAAGSTTMACAAPTDDDAEGSEDDLTSITARTRQLQFAGYVYVDRGASDYEIKAAIKSQTQSAFGALRTATVGVNTRELRDVDTSTFLKTDVDVIDPANRSGAPTQMTKVSYTYTDNALVPNNLATRSAIELALLGDNYQSQTDRIIRECTANDSEAHEFSSAVWYVFDPSGSACRTAMTAEQKKIDTDRQGMTAKQVPTSEVNRLYIPMTAKLKSTSQNTALKYPEYDKLYSGGVQPGKLVIGMVSGMMADWAAGEHHDTYEDSGYDMWMQGLREVFKARPMTLTSVEGVADPLHYTVGGKKITFNSFNDIMAFELDNRNPAGVTSANRNAVRKAVADTIAKKFVTFDANVQVTIKGQTKPFTIELQSFFGAETDSTPHKRAIKTSDVFVYNGHAYIGYGPLDPTNFRATDFPSSYQVMMVNACVSYNYYEKDFFPLKGGTKNLDMVTNGLESWVNESGPAMGRFVGAIIDGKQNTYQDILKAAQFTYYGYDWGMDALRVVDGELDNKYKPSTTPIVVQ